PVGMARARPNTWPNTSSQSAGCTDRVKTSVGSRRSLRSSTSAMANVSRVNSAIADTQSAKAPRRSSGPGHVTIRSSFVDGAPREVHEDVVQGRAVADRGLELGRRAERDDPALVHDRQPLAERFGLVH